MLRLGSIIFFFSVLFNSLNAYVCSVTTWQMPEKLGGAEVTVLGDIHLDDNQGHTQILNNAFSPVGICVLLETPENFIQYKGKTNSDIEKLETNCSLVNIISHAVQRNDNKFLFCDKRDYSSKAEVAIKNLGKEYLKNKNITSFLLDTEDKWKLQLLFDEIEKNTKDLEQYNQKDRNEPIQQYLDTLKKLNKELKTLFPDKSLSIAQDYDLFKELSNYTDELFIIHDYIKLRYELLKKIARTIADAGFLQHVLVQKDFAKKIFLYCGQAHAESINKNLEDLSAQHLKSHKGTFSWFQWFSKTDKSIEPPLSAQELSEALGVPFTKTKSAFWKKWIPPVMFGCILYYLAFHDGFENFKRYFAQIKH